MSLYWIDREGVRLGIMPRPRGNDWLSDDLRLLRQAGVDVIVSALTALEAEELGSRRKLRNALRTACSSSHSQSKIAQSPRLVRTLARWSTNYWNTQEEERLSLSIAVRESGVRR